MPNQPPTVTLALRGWPIPVLAPRQNRIVVPALLKLIPKILAARNETGPAGSLLHLARYLDTETYDLLSELVFTALTRARPDLARAEFDDMAIDTLELIRAVHTIARQAGLIRRDGDDG